MATQHASNRLPISLSHCVGSPLTSLLAAAQRIGLGGTNAVICGEEGTGKEDLARLIHATGAGAAGPLSIVQPRGRDAEALARALFGAEPPAPRRAPGETLLVEEIAELPWELQGRLARALAGEPGRAAAGAAPVPRLVATSTRELLPLVAAGTFRRDLYDALSCCLRVPPLRERRDDVLALVDRGWEALGERRVIAESALELLRQYTWPGNAGEVLAFTRRLAANASAPTISVRDVEHELFLSVTGLSCWGPERDLPCAAGVAGGEAPGSAFRRVVGEAGRAFASEDQVDLAAALRAIEGGLVDWALERAGGSKAGAAQLLGIRRTTLVEKLRRRREGPARHGDAEPAFAGGGGVPDGVAAALGAPGGAHDA